MNVKQLKALRKGQYELMQTLRGQLDEDSYHRLNDYLSSAVQLVKDTNTTTEARLLAENKKLKRQLAEQDEQHRAELIRLRQQCSKEQADKVSGVEAKYQKKTAELEATVAALQHIDALAGKGLLQLNEIACTSKAFTVAKRCFSTEIMPRLFRIAVDAAVLCIDQKKDIRLNWGDFDIVPYLTNKGWNVFICCKGELSAVPTLLRVSEYAVKRALT